MEALKAWRTASFPLKRFVVLATASTRAGMVRCCSSSSTSTSTRSPRAKTSSSSSPSSSSTSDRDAVRAIRLKKGRCWKNLIKRASRVHFTR